MDWVEWLLEVFCFLYFNIAFLMIALFSPFALAT